jgi:hypothetical protein
MGLQGSNGHLDSRLIMNHICHVSNQVAQIIVAIVLALHGFTSIYALL